MNYVLSSMFGKDIDQEFYKSNRTHAQGMFRDIWDCYVKQGVYNKEKFAYEILKSLGLGKRFQGFTEDMVIYVFNDFR